VWFLGPAGLFAAQGGIFGAMMGVQIGVSSAAAIAEAQFLSAIAAGFAAGGIQGGNVQSALQGAFFAAVTFGIGELGASGRVPFAGRVAAHAAVGCASSAAAGGSCRAGAAAAGFSALAGPLVDGPPAARLAMAMVVGGAASRISGGNFQNGAMTAAFAYLLNDALHPENRPWKGLGPPPAIAQAQHGLAASIDRFFAHVADTLDYIFKSDSVILARNMAQDSGLEREPGQHAHHIVAANDPRAEPARQVLALVGMSINSAFNGVFLDPAYHASLHTNLYYQNVNLMLSGAVNYPDVAARLTIIRGQLMVGTFRH
jgi:hypothetical protein